MSTLFDPSAMKLPPTPVSLLLARLGQARRSLQASLRALAPLPAPALVPIPVQVDRGRHDSMRRRRHQGV